MLSRQICCGLAATVLATTVLATTVAGAAEPTLVGDTRPGAVPSAAAPRDVVSVGGVTYFAAVDGLHGRELWRTDGTTLGTQLAVDFVSGHLGSDPRWLVAFGDRLLAGVAIPERGLELWVTDGTLAGSELLADGCPGTCAGLWSRPEVIGGLAYFVGFDPGHGLEPWVTDGTAAGTRRLLDGCPGACSSEVADFGDLAGVAIFSVGERDLWRSDGTADGTRPFAELSPTHGTEAKDFVTFGAHVYYSANPDPEHLGWELWRTDGVTVQLVADLLAGPASSNARPMFVFDGQLWVHAGGPWGAGGEPGSCEPAGIILPFPPDDCMLVEDGDLATPLVDTPATVEGLLAWTVAGDVLYFVEEVEPRVVKAVHDATDYAHDLFVLSGVPAPIAPLPWLMAPLGDGGEGAVVATGPYGKIYRVLLPPPQLPVAPMVVELSAGAIAPARIDELASTPFGVAFAGDGVVSQSHGVEPGSALWGSDGSVAGTGTLPVFFPLAGGDPEPIAVGGDTLIYDAVDGTLDPPNRAYFATTGPPSGAVPLGELAVDEGAELDGVLYVAAGRFAPGVNETGLWRIDGTAASLVYGGIIASSLKVAAGPGGEPRLWFARGVDTGQELWVSDGTADGTRMVVRLHPDYVAYPPIGLPPPFAVTYPRRIASLGADRVLFDAYDDETGRFELWVSDGTVGATLAVTFDHPLGDLHAIGERVLVEVLGDTVRRELWSYDGDRLAQLPVGDIGGALDAFPVTTRGNEAFFFVDSTPPPPGSAAGGASSSVAGEDPLLLDELWRTDGTPTGTFPVAFLGAGVGGRELVTAGARLYLTTTTLAGRRVLWTSDGSEHGTRRLPLAADPVAFPGELTGLADGTLLFAAADPEHGRELWRADGTPLGTALVADLAPGASSSSPASLRVATNQVYFAANDLVHGRELFSLAIAPPGGCVADATTLCLRGGRYAVRAFYRDPRAGVGEQVEPAQARPFSGESGAFWFFRPENLEPMVKILDGERINGHHWVFVSSLTSFEVTIEIDDLATGAQRTYAGGAFCGVADVQAFPARPGEGVSTAALVAPTLGQPAPNLTPPFQCAGSTGAPCLELGGLGIALTWTNPRTGATGFGVPVVLTDRVGGFSFFAGTNLEVLVKVLDGTPVNGHRWLFHGGMTDLAYRLEVFDLAFGTPYGTVERPAGSLCGGAVLDRF